MFAFLQIINARLKKRGEYSLVTGDGFSIWYETMNSFGDLISKRRYLLPLLVTVSFFFFSQGIVLPNLVSPQEALSKPQEIKWLSCIVGKAQLKSSQCRIVKAVPYVALHRKTEIINQQPSYRTVFDQQFHVVGLAVDPSVPARAPPA